MEGGKVAKLRTNQCVVLKIKAYIVEQRKIQTLTFFGIVTVNMELLILKKLPVG